MTSKKPQDPPVIPPGRGGPSALGTNINERYDGPQKRTKLPVVEWALNANAAGSVHIGAYTLVLNVVLIGGWWRIVVLATPRLTSEEETALALEKVFENHQHQTLPQRHISFTAALKTAEQFAREWKPAACNCDCETMP